MNSQVARMTENIVFPEVLLEPTEVLVIQISVVHFANFTCLFPIFLHFFSLFLLILVQYIKQMAIIKLTDKLS
jgi:hypothetical protein